MHRVALGLSAAGLSIIFAASQVAGQAAPAPSPVSPPAAAAATSAGQLPPGPGHDTMVRVCSACHAPEIAATQRLSASGWKDLVDTMASRGAPGSDADFAEITAYLAKSFPDKPAS